VQWRWWESLCQKKLLCSVTVAKRSFCDTAFCLNKLITVERMYVVTPNCLWSVGCQIASILTFLTGAFAKLKRACETLRSCAKRLGGLAVINFPGALRSFNPALVEGPVQRMQAVPNLPQKANRWFSSFQQWRHHRLSCNCVCHSVTYTENFREGGQVSSQSCDVKNKL